MTGTWKAGGWEEPAARLITFAKKEQGVSHIFVEAPCGVKKMKVVRPESEKRDGIIFVGTVRNSLFGDGSTVKLYMENGGKYPVGKLYIERKNALDSLVDLAFLKWLTEGLFRKTVKDPELLEIFETARGERKYGVAWFRRTHRFVPMDLQSGMFILTTDKSDLSDHYKRVLEIGEEAVRKEEEEAEKQRISREEKYVLEEVPKTPLIRAAVHRAIGEKQRVVLVVKGFRPMFEPLAKYGYNYFWFEGFSGNVPVPAVCQICGIDPKVVHDEYFSERGMEAPTFEERAQPTADLFPFAEIEWKRERGSTGEIYRLAITNKSS